MEPISCVASLSQLAVYVNCTVTRLSHLYRTISTATFLAKSQLEELHILLKILERIEKHHSPSDTELLVPVLISIANTVQTLENWFGPSSTIRLQWNLIAHKADIEEALRLLRRQYNLLAFYYTEQNYSALSRIESCLSAHPHAVPGSSAEMSFPPQNQNNKPNLALAKRSMASEGGELTLQTASTAVNRIQPPFASGNRFRPPFAPSNPFQSPPTGMQPAQFPGRPPPAGAQSDQFPRQGEGNPSQKEKQAGTKFTVAENEFLWSTTRFNNTSRPDHKYEAEYKKNKTVGGSTDFGCQSPNQDSNGRSQERYPPTHPPPRA